MCISFKEKQEAKQGLVAVSDGRSRAVRLGGGGIASVCLAQQLIKETA